MELFIFVDMTSPRDTSGQWDAKKDAESHKRGADLLNYFNDLARKEGVEDKVPYAIYSHGFAPTMITAGTDAVTAKKIEAASNGRLAIAKIDLH